MTLKRHDLLQRTTAQLQEVAGDAARFEAEALIKLAVRSEDSLVLSAGEIVTGSQISHLEQLLDQRMNHRLPVSRIRGYKDFWKHRFLINEHVLDPRADSETLVEAAIRYGSRMKAPRILDVGTGSGCLLLSILADLPEATGLGVDLSTEALKIARENAVLTGVSARCEFRAGNWLDGIDERFDLLICNPPYIDQADKSWMSPEVLDHDPEGALFAQNRGLLHYEHLFVVLADYMKPGGVALFEHGYDQRGQVCNMASDAGLEIRATLDDLSGQPRCLVLSSN